MAAGPGDTTILVVGDVVGRGVEAARHASFVRAALTAFVPFTDDPRRLLQMANHSLIEKSGLTESFVAAACVAFRPEDSSFEVALAGYPAPLCLDEDVEIDVSPGMPLGVDADLRCEVAHLRLPEGTGLLLFTDGLTEARRGGSANGTPSEEGAVALFGGERLDRALADLRGRGPGHGRPRAARRRGELLGRDACRRSLPRRRALEPRSSSPAASRCLGRRCRRV